MSTSEDKDVPCDTYYYNDAGDQYEKSIVIQMDPDEFEWDTHNAMLIAKTGHENLQPIAYGVFMLTRELRDHDTYQTTMSGPVQFVIDNTNKSMVITIDAYETGQKEQESLACIHYNHLNGMGKNKGTVSSAGPKRSVHYHFEKREALHEDASGDPIDELADDGYRQIEDLATKGVWANTITEERIITLVYVCELHVPAGKASMASRYTLATSARAAVPPIPSTTAPRIEEASGRHAMSAYRCDMAVAMSKGDARKLQRLQEQAPPGTGPSVGALSVSHGGLGAEARAAYGLDGFAALTLAERAAQYTSACARLQEHHKKRPGNISAHMDTYVSYISPMAAQIPRALHKHAADIFQ